MNIGPFRYIIFEIMVLFLGLAQVNVQAETLPTTEQFDSSLRTCAAGQHIELNADIIGSISSVYNNQRTQGALSFKDQTEFLSLIPESQRLEAYRLYVECVRTILKPATIQSKDRSKIVNQLQQFYASGSAILLSPQVTDQQIYQARDDASKWLNSSALWIDQNMGTPARIKFLNNSDKLSRIVVTSGEKISDDARKTRNDILNTVSGCLANLETLMKDDRRDKQVQ